ncbi:MAG: sensor histidine kinase, partial [Eisenbergiella sp.]
EHVRQYLYIQKERYGDKLSYEIRVPEEFLDYTVPKIILQPIVENSIYHGIKPMEGLGRILVTAREEGEYLIFMVEDNGEGFAPASLNDGRCVRKGSVGLKNVEERLKLYYGQDCGV